MPWVVQIQTLVSARACVCVWGGGGGLRACVRVCMCVCLNLTCWGTRQFNTWPNGSSATHAPGIQWPSVIGIVCVCVCCIVYCRWGGWWQCSVCTASYPPIRLHRCWTVCAGCIATTEGWTCRGEYQWHWHRHTSPRESRWTYGWSPSIHKSRSCTTGQARWTDVLSIWRDQWEWWGMLRFPMLSLRKAKERIHILLHTSSISKRAVDCCMKVYIACFRLKLNTWHPRLGQCC